MPSHRTRFLPVLLLLVSLASAQTLTILHTNDMHASFMPHEAFWVKSTPKPMVGGFGELYFTVDSIRKAKPAVLVLDGGDVMTGNPITEREYKGALGGALFEMMNAVGYDAWAPGNHDLDLSQANLTALGRIARFPMISANLMNTSREYPVGNRPYVIIERGGIKVGIIGIISQELYGLVNQNNLVGIRVLSPVETLQKYIDELDPQTDLLIALTHQGVEEDSALATGVRGLDIIVGAHSHTRLKVPKMVNGVIIVQAGSNCENLGQLDVTVDGHRVVKYDGKLIPLWARNDRPEAWITTFADSLQREIDREYSEVIATLTGDWVRANSGQSAIGTFIADAQREAAYAEVGFMNNFGIRKDLAAGPLTKKDLFEILPFRNMLTTFQLSGRQLRGILKYSLEKRPAIQIAGMTAVYKRKADSTVALNDVRVMGKPLDDERMYICAASDYMVGEAKRYLGIEPTNVSYSSQTLFGVVEEAVRKAGRITPMVLYRIDEAQ
jgi:5'-nucleotidase/UDP-sugar diphosphatase